MEELGGAYPFGGVESFGLFHNGAKSIRYTVYRAYRRILRFVVFVG